MNLEEYKIKHKDTGFGGFTLVVISHPDYTGEVLVLNYDKASEFIIKNKAKWNKRKIDYNLFEFREVVVNDAELLIIFKEHFPEKFI